MRKHKEPATKIHNLSREATFLWCLHCERTYVRGEYRLAGELQMCPYENCDGDTVLDAWPWEQIRGVNPTYPAKPIKGEHYPQYGRKN